MLHHLAYQKGLIRWGQLDLPFLSTSRICGPEPLCIRRPSSTLPLPSLKGRNTNYPRRDRLDWVDSRMKYSSSSSSSSNDQHNNNSNSNRGVRDGENPFTILGIPQTSSYDAVKRRFLELALQHHPDLAGKNSTSRGKNESDADDRLTDTTTTTTSRNDTDNFIRFRQAFEAVKENSDGSASLRSSSSRSSRDNNNIWTDEEFQAWFYEETGHSDVMFRMDLKTRKEVIDVAESQSQGGLDKGGMWEMARSMAEQEQALMNQKSKFNRSVGVAQSSSSSLCATECTEPSVRRRRRT
jgi:phage shock protein A